LERVGGENWHCGKGRRQQRRRHSCAANSAEEEIDRHTRYSKMDPHFVAAERNRLMCECKFL